MSRQDASRAAWTVVRKGARPAGGHGRYAVSAEAALAGVRADNRRYMALKPAVRARQAALLADKITAEADEAEGLGVCGDGVVATLSAWFSEVPGGAEAVDVVCLGLGRISGSRNARAQLAMALRLRRACGVGGAVLAYDPVQSRLDEDVLAQLGVAVIERNEEGKRRVEGPTLFYMPHCGRTLYSNAVWANWDRLERVFVLGNSFAACAGSFHGAAAGPPPEAFASLRAAMPLVEEVPCGLDERACAERGLAGAFNDLSVHRFRGDTPGDRPPEYLCGGAGGGGGGMAADPELIPAAATRAAGCGGGSGDQCC